MRLVPESNVGKIQFFEVHLEPWTEHAAEIGADPAMVAELAAQTQAAREALIEQQAAQAAARAATLKLRTVVDAMASTGSTIILQVRGRSRMSGNGVYSLAQIASPAEPSPMAPPGTPQRFTVELQPIGWITLRWKCRNPRGAVGTLYHVHRRINAGSGAGDAFEYIGTTGRKTFVDKSIPAGAGAVTYQVQAVRSTASGAVAQFNVTFGMSGNGRAPASVGESRGKAIAA
jgi:hypothetical protein